MESQEVCYTREVALEKAIDMEANSFDVYRGAYLRADERRAKDLLRDLALDELKHKYTLEKAFFEETILLHESGSASGPTMKLAMLLEEKPLGKNPSQQDILIYAIHDEKRSVDFYKAMAGQCVGAPMEGMFKTLAGDEENHLARLEELYESIYMKDM
jgi:rubrerythrin